MADETGPGDRNAGVFPFKGQSQRAACRGSGEPPAGGRVRPRVIRDSAAALAASLGSRAPLDLHGSAPTAGC